MKVSLYVLHDPIKVFHCAQDYLAFNLLLSVLSIPFSNLAASLPLWILEDHQESILFRI